MVLGNGSITLLLTRLGMSNHVHMDQSLLGGVTETPHEVRVAGDRERALNYFKGEMPDIGALPNRSRAVSIDIADPVDTVLPDLIEIFTGGDDVSAFMPQKLQDEQAAQQETDYVNHVVFHENDGM